MLDELKGLYPESWTSTVSRDLRLNLQRLLTESSLEKGEGLSVLLALATAAGDKTLSDFARMQLKAGAASDEEIRESAEAAAIMGMLNTYYRFKSHIENRDDYPSAGLRMTSLAKPHLGKTRFEMLAFAVSVLNGCHSCINAHEKVLRDEGIALDKVHDLARLAAVVKGLAAMPISPM
jgi:lipoyl-dependent peroxiredoxin subunit D